MVEIQKHNVSRRDDMSYAMIRYKLESGEDALDLSIKAWEFRLEVVESGFDTKRLQIGGGNCPLCVKYRDIRNQKDCGDCPLAKNGFKCTDKGSIFEDVYNKFYKEDPKTGMEYTKEEKVMATNKLLSLLKICKKLNAGKDISKMERVQLFTECEIKHRLKQGDTNAIDLAIEVWRARENYIALGGNMNYLKLGVPYCPLCVEYRKFYGTGLSRCERCPLANIKSECVRPRSAYRTVALLSELKSLPNFIRRPLLVKACNRMIRTMQEAKCRSK